MFRKIGEPVWKAWVPVVNVATVLKLGGFSPWLVLINLVPLFGFIAFVVVYIVAVHRITVGFGAGAGLTVLGALVPVVWASVLGFGAARWEGSGARGVDEDSAPVRRGRDFEGPYVPLIGGWTPDPEPAAHDRSADPAPPVSEPVVQPFAAPAGSLADAVPSPSDWAPPADLMPGNPDGRRSTERHAPEEPSVPATPRRSSTCSTRCATALPRVPPRVSGPTRIPRPRPRTRTRMPSSPRRDGSPASPRRRPSPARKPAPPRPAPCSCRELPRVACRRGPHRARPIRPRSNPRRRPTSPRPPHTTRRPPAPPTTRRRSGPALPGVVSREPTRHRWTSPKHPSPGPPPRRSPPRASRGPPSMSSPSSPKRSRRCPMRPTRALRVRLARRCRRCTRVRRCRRTTTSTLSTARSWRDASASRGR